MARTHTPHLTTALLAGVSVILILCVGRVMAIHLEGETIHATAPRDFWLKNQGLAFQRAAARTPDILLLYGSSELIDPIPNRASDFFSHEPSGFQVCPVGKGGATALNILQKLAALGSDLRGRKIAIWVSPSSFFKPEVKAAFYAGNFSPEAASAMLSDKALDSKLKGEIARRMQQYPTTLAKSPLLQLTVSSFAADNLRDRITLAALAPLRSMQNSIFDLQDHFEALIYLWSGGKSAISRRELRRFDLTEQMSPDEPSDSSVGSPIKSSQSKTEASGTRQTRIRQSVRDMAFRTRVAKSEEWLDFDLLCRTVAEIGAKPLILSMPIDISRNDMRGVSKEGRRFYYDKLRELVQSYHFPLVEAQEHDADATFLIAHREHPTPSGWRYYDHALDAFFHNNKF